MVDAHIARPADTFIDPLFNDQITNINDMPAVGRKSIGLEHDLTDLGMELEVIFHFRNHQVCPAAA